MHEVLTTNQLADYLSISERTLIRWRVQRVGPAWTKVGHHVRYRKTDVDAWLERKRCEPVRERSAG
jgi:excisionase family DNA binding protein